VGAVRGLGVHELPEDAAVMYEDETYSGARLTEESIRLWERHTGGYVKEVRRGTAG
jgi:hypothetical protein